MDLWFEPRDIGSRASQHGLNCTRGGDETKQLPSNLRRAFTGERRRSPGAGYVLCIPNVGGQHMTGRRREPVLLYSVLLTAVGVFLTITGSRDGNTGTLIIGIVCLLLFGLATIVLLAQRFGRLPSPATPRSGSRWGGARSGSRLGRDWAVPIFVHEGPLPELNSEAKEELQRVIALLVDYGFFVPEAPSPEQLEAPAADYGEPVVLSSVLSSVFTAPSYHANFDIDRYTQNLHFHLWKMEQSSGVIERQMIDLVDLCDGALIVDDVTIDQSKFPRVTVSATVNGESFESSYAGSNKWMARCSSTTSPRSMSNWGCQPALPS